MYEAGDFLTGWKKVLCAVAFNGPRDVWCIVCADNIMRYKIWFMIVRFPYCDLFVRSICRLGWVRAAWEFRSIFLANFQCWFISLISCIFLPNTQWPTEEWWKKNDLAGTPIFGSIQSQFWGIKSHFCSWTPLFLTSQLQRCHASPQGCRRLIRCKRRRSDFADIADVLWLVGGLEHEFYDFPFSWECHHPKWRSYFSEG